MPVFDITSKCNMRCVYCNRHSFQADEDELSNDKILEVFRQLINIRSRFIAIQGGEPLIKGDILCLIKDIEKLRAEESYFKRRENYDLKEGLAALIVKQYSGRMFVNSYYMTLRNSGLPFFLLSTNGSICNDELIDAMLRAGLYLEMSLDGVHKETHEQKRKGLDFDELIKNIRSYSEKIPVELVFTVHNDNIREISDFIAFAEDLDCTAIRFSPLRSIGRAKSFSFSNIRHFARTIYKAIEHFDRSRNRIIVRLQMLYGHLLSLDHFEQVQKFLESVPNLLVEWHKCTAFEKLDDIYINQNLEVFGCCQMNNTSAFKIGSLKGNTIREIWDSDRRRALLNLRQKRKEQLESCRCCKFLADCNAGCLATSYEKYGKFYNPETECYAHKQA